MDENEQSVPPRYYVTFAGNSGVSGFYVDVIHGDSIPVDAVPITAEQWQTYSADARLYKLDADGVTIRLKTQQELDDEATNQSPVEPSPEQQQIAQLQTGLAAANDATLTAYDALADVYEMVLALQDQIAGSDTE